METLEAIESDETIQRYSGTAIDTKPTAGYMGDSRAKRTEVAKGPAKQDGGILAKFPPIQPAQETKPAFTTSIGSGERG